MVTADGRVRLPAAIRGLFGGNIRLRKNWRISTMFEYKAGDYTFTIQQTRANDVSYRVVIDSSR